MRFFSALLKNANYCLTLYRSENVLIKKFVLLMAKNKKVCSSNQEGFFCVYENAPGAFFCTFKNANYCLTLYR